MHKPAEHTHTRQAVCISCRHASFPLYPELRSHVPEMHRAHARQADHLVCVVRLAAGALAVTVRLTSTSRARSTAARAARSTVRSLARPDRAGVGRVPRERWSTDLSLSAVEGAVITHQYPRRLTVLALQYPRLHKSTSCQPPHVCEDRLYLFACVAHMRRFYVCMCACHDAGARLRCSRPRIRRTLSRTWPSMTTRAIVSPAAAET